MRNDDNDKSPEVGQRSHEEREERLTQELQLAADLSQFGDRVGTFAARSTSLDRDALMFAAGRASAGGTTTPVGTRLMGSPRTWQAATAVMTITACSLAVLLVTRPVPEPRVIVMERERPIGKKIEHSPALTAQAINDAAISKDQISPADDRPDSEGDRQLADAWKARQQIISQGDWNEGQLALAAPALGTTNSINDSSEAREPPLTQSTVMGERSREAIHRLLKEQL